MVKKIFVSLDLESITNVDIVGIGLVVGNEKGKILEKKRWWISRKDIEINPVIKKEFWDIYTIPYNDWQNNGKDEKFQIKEFVSFYDNIANKYKVEEKNIVLVNDNPEFDFGRLTPYINKYCGREPLRYTTKGEYRPICDLGECTEQLDIYRIVSKFATKIQKHDHHPDNDAAHNYIFHILGNEVFKEINSKLGNSIKKIANDICNKKIKDLTMLNN